MGECEEIARPDTSDLPETVAPGTVLLVVGPDAPAEDGRCLQVLHRYADTEDVGIVVTTTAGAEETIGTNESITGETPAAPIGVVDTASMGQNVTAFHQEVPAIYAPGPADLARVSVAVDNLDAQLTSSGTSHLVVRSVTPFFEGDDSTSVVPGIERTFGTWSTEGIAVLGVDFTAVDESTLTALQELADAVVRVAVTASGDHRLEYRGASPS